jgi:hypothetical protein
MLGGEDLGEHFLTKLGKILKKGSKTKEVQEYPKLASVYEEFDGS